MICRHLRRMPSRPLKLLEAPSCHPCKRRLTSSSSNDPAVAAAAASETKRLHQETTSPYTSNVYETPFVIFDTGRNSKWWLTSRRKNILTWYSCGPTVYASSHIGHASSFIRQDVIRRILESLGPPNFTIIQVMGITDIDDKIIRKAHQTESDWSSVSRHFEKEFKEDLSKLNLLPPHMFTRVSDYIPQILQFVEKLIYSGFAYAVPDGSVYFDTEKYGSRYGKFRQVQDEVEDPDPESSLSGGGGKRAVKDFALWKGAKPDEPYWQSPWGTGRGRPGWHIECSVMASHIFGTTLDLHTGGRDLIFPHHENEEAQCCAHFNSNRWTSHWLHMGHLHLKGDVKMSKSLGNTVSIPDFLSHHSADVLRMSCINSKYRNNLEYSADTIDIAKKFLKKFRAFLGDAEAIMNGSRLVRLAPGNDESALWTKLEASKKQLEWALKDDFDTPEALKITTDFMSDFNRTYVHVNDSHNSCVNFELVLASKLFVQEFLNLIGFIEFSSAKTNLERGSSSDNKNNLQYVNLVDQFVQFRNEVRSFSLALDETDKALRKEKIGDRKILLNACDTVRNTILEENQIEIKDHGKSSSWSFVDKK